MGLAFLLSLSTHFKDDFTLFQWFIGLSILSVLIGFRAACRYGLIPGLALGYILIHAVYTFSCRWNYYGLHAHHLIHQAAENSLMSVASILLITLSLLFVCKKALISILLNFKYYALLDAIYVLMAAATPYIAPGNTGFTGYIGPASLNGSVIAIGAAIFLMEKRYLVFLLMLVAIALSGSSIPYGVLSVSIVAGLIACGRYWQIPILGGIGIVGWVFEGKYFFDSAGRFDAYKLFMTEWYNKGLTLFGTGLGSFKFIAPIIQCQKQHLVNEACHGFVYQEMHSDWLQVLFELGYVGFGITALLFFLVIKSLYANRRLPHMKNAFVMFLGLSSLAVFSYPLHEFVTATLFAVCVVSALRLSR